jgi:hypothetical protein
VCSPGPARRLPCVPATYSEDNEAEALLQGAELRILTARPYRIPLFQTPEPPYVRVGSPMGPQGSSTRFVGVSQRVFGAAGC